MKFFSLILFIGLALSSCRREPQENFLVGIQIQDRNGVSETISIPEKLEVYHQMDFLSSQPFKKVIRVYKKEGKNSSIITTYHPNGQIWKYLEAEDMRASGLYREWFSTGQLKIAAQVIGGTADVGVGAQSDWLFEGICEVWDEQGNFVARIPYEKGALQGATLHFYPSGQVQSEAPYLQNLLEGEMIEYFPNGQIKSQISYRKGIKQGLSLGYGMEGNLLWTEEYKDDFLQNGTYFTLEGEKISTVHNRFGFQTFFDENLGFQQIEIQKGVQEGSIKQFSSNQELQWVYQLKNGKKNGEEIVYYLPIELDAPSSQPILKLSIQWNDDKIHGLVKTWYKNGSLESQKEWARNKKNGTSCSWYLDGTLMLIEEYEEDLLQQGQYFKKTGKEPVSTVIQGNGLATLYDDQGLFLRKVIYHKGKTVDPEN